MNSLLHRIGWAALLLTSSLAVVPTHAQNADPLPLDVRLRTVVVQGTLWSEDWGPNPGPNDAPGVRLPVEILPSIVRHCTPLSCPPEPLGASPVTLGPGGFFTMPVVLPEQLLSDTNVVGLQFAVRTNTDQPFILLSGTLPFAATPFATVAQSVVGPIPAELLTGSMPTGFLRSAFSSSVALTNAGNVLAGDGSRVAHVDAATLGGFTACNLPCYWNLSGNAGTDPTADFMGTTDGAGLTIGVGNLAALRINRSAGPGTSPNLVGGDPANSVSPGSRGSVIGGGGAADQPNVINESTFGVIGGGLGNEIRDRGNSIVGGAKNRAGGTNSVVGGGYGNSAVANYGTVGGGTGNVASGLASTVPGGMSNVASGAGSFAAGTRARAVSNGSFVWSDSQNAEFSSTADNQFAVRAQNGVMIQGATTALDLRGNGAIRVAGAGIASQGPVFIHRAAAGNLSGHITTIDHPLCNGDPNAILIVTHNYSADASSTPYESNAVGVWYNGSRWTIYHENTSVAMPVGRAFNVIVIKP